jgi:hypothetical protein
MKISQIYKIADQLTQLSDNLSMACCTAREGVISKKFQKYSEYTIQNIRDINELRFCVLNIIDWLEIEDNDYGLEPQQLKKLEKEARKAWDLYEEIPKTYLPPAFVSLLNELENRF